MPPYVVTHAQTGLSFFRGVPTLDVARAAARIAEELCSTWEFPASVVKELVAMRERKENDFVVTKTPEEIMAPVWSSSVFGRLQDLRNICDFLVAV